MKFRAITATNSDADIIEVESLEQLREISLVYHDALVLSFGKNKNSNGISDVKEGELPILMLYNNWIE